MSRLPRKGCSHLEGSLLMHREVGIWTMWTNVCALCGELLSLGHSDETPVAVAIEIRAAELAFNDGPIRTCDNAMPDDCEECGWDCWPFANAMHDATEAQWAGYLARCIYDHDKEHP